MWLKTFEVESKSRSDLFLRTQNTVEISRLLEESPKWKVSFASLYFSEGVIQIMPMENKSIDDQNVTEMQFANICTCIS